MNITGALTDNGKSFNERLFNLRKRPATGQHEFYQLCADFGIEHHDLASQMRSQTNGMVARFNGLIEDVVQSHSLQNALAGNEVLAQT